MAKETPVPAVIVTGSVLESEPVSVIVTLEVFPLAGRVYDFPTPDTSTNSNPLAPEFTATSLPP